MGPSSGGPIGVGADVVCGLRPSDTRCHVKFEGLSLSGGGDHEGKLYVAPSRIDAGAGEGAAPDGVVRVTHRPIDRRRG